MLTQRAARKIARAQANELLKARALQLYHTARTQRDEYIRALEAEYGRADRVDQTLGTLPVLTSR